MGGGQLSLAGPLPLACHPPSSLSSCHHLIIILLLSCHCCRSWREERGSLLLLPLLQISTNEKKEEKKEKNLGGWHSLAGPLPLLTAPPLSLSSPSEGGERAIVSCCHCYKLIISSTNEKKEEKTWEPVLAHH